MYIVQSILDSYLLCRTSCRHKFVWKVNCYSVQMMYVAVRNYGVCVNSSTPWNPQ